MISKKYRVNKSLFNIIFKQGKIIHTPIFIFKYIKNLDNKGFYSFVVPKTVAKTAVKRNSLRRKGYNVLSKIGAPIGFSGVFFYKKGTSLSNNEQIKDSVTLSLENLK